MNRCFSGGGCMLIGGVVDQSQAYTSLVGGSIAQALAQHTLLTGTHSTLLVPFSLALQFLGVALFCRHARPSVAHQVAVARATLGSVAHIGVAMVDARILAILEPITRVACEAAHKERLVPILLLLSVQRGSLNDGQCLLPLQRIANGANDGIHHLRRGHVGIVHNGPLMLFSPCTLIVKAALACQLREAAVVVVRVVVVLVVSSHFVCQRGETLCECKPLFATFVPHFCHIQPTLVHPPHSTAGRVCPIEEAWGGA